jgi:hypothetical protein
LGEPEERQLSLRGGGSVFSTFTPFREDFGKKSEVKFFRPFVFARISDSREK